MSPDALHLTPTGLLIDWPDGKSHEYSASYLRRSARDASTLRERYDTGTVVVAENLQVTAAEPVGAYGVNIRFSDGHERAIFPFVYLQELMTTS